MASLSSSITRKFNWPVRIGRELGISRNWFGTGSELVSGMRCCCPHSECNGTALNSPRECNSIFSKMLLIDILWSFWKSALNLLWICSESALNLLWICSECTNGTRSTAPKTAPILHLSIDLIDLLKFMANLIVVFEMRTRALKPQRNRNGTASELPLTAPTGTRKGNCPGHRCIYFYFRLIYETLFLIGWIGVLGKLLLINPDTCQSRCSAPG